MGFRTIDISQVLPVVAELVLPGNSSRRGIIFNGGSGSAYRFGQRDLFNGLGWVISVTPGVPVQLTYADWGELICAEWWAFNGGFGTQGFVTEVFLLPGCV